MATVAGELLLLATEAESERLQGRFRFLILFLQIPRRRGRMLFSSSQINADKKRQFAARPPSDGEAGHILTSTAEIEFHKVFARLASSLFIPESQRKILPSLLI